jgi:hypothetical protein
MRILLVVVAAIAAACAPATEPSGDCAGPADCAPEEDAPCAGCPPLSVELCVSGACEARGDDAVDLTGDVNIDRGINPSVVSFVHVLAERGEQTCADVFDGDSLSSAVSVLAAGYKATSGGSFHQGVTLGRSPAGGDLLVIVWATDDNAGEGSVLGKGCVQADAVAEPSHDVGVIDVD